MAITVAFEPVGREGEWRENETLLECARRLGVHIATACGGRGSCRSCRVLVTEGRVASSTDVEAKVFSAEEMAEGWRRACQTYPATGCRVVVPARSLLSRQRTQIEGEESAVPIEPAVQCYAVEIPPPSLQDLRADSERVLAALAKGHGVRCNRIDLALARELRARLQAQGWKALAAVRGEEVIGLLPTDSGPLGLAVDVGTTKLAAYLVDLRDGRMLAAHGEMNPQIKFGDDVISRITHATGSPAAHRELREVMVRELSRMAAFLCRKVSLRSEQIVDSVVAGNTAMHHLLLELPVSQLARAPYVPAVSEAMDVKAREIGLSFAPGAYVHLLPNIAGFIGGDHTAVLMAVGADRAEGTQLYLDIGTNTEVSLVSGGAIHSVSCASGPAFEGGHIRDGMRAAPGAIERFWLIGGRPHYQTIDGEPPVGICGSGILDTVAELYRGGILHASGRMEIGYPRVRERGKVREFVIVSELEKDAPPAIVLTQQDVRELQLAKAAIRTGIDMLLGAVGIPVEAIDRVVIAGAFGNYIDVAGALAIGMLPTLPRERFHQVGNAAGVGARQALISRLRREDAKGLAAAARYQELAGEPSFSTRFTENLSFPQASFDRPGCMA